MEAVFICAHDISGIRGELCVMVKVDLFSDFNRFRQSSCGVQFFSSKSHFTCSEDDINEISTTWKMLAEEI